METEQQAAGAEERLAAAERALEEALAERNRLWAQLNEQRADERELEELRREVAVMRGSTFWKLAVRYQRIKRLLRLGLRRLREL